MALAAKKKMAEAAEAEKAHRDMAKEAETKATPEVIKEAPKKATVKAAAVVAVVAKPEVASKKVVAPVAAKEVAKVVVAAPKVAAAKNGNFLVAAAAPAAAGAGAPGAAGAPGGAVENLNDKMPLKAAEQGFAGKKVKHEDGKTAAADWQNEYATH